MGWPKSATFRTIDLVGLDILGHVVGNMTANVHDERSDLRLPEFLQQMIQHKWLGDKTKGGFYKKAKSHAGKEDERLALDWKTLEYHPRQKPKFAALDMAKNIEDTGARLRTLLGLEGSGPQKGDKAGAFLWSALSDLWTYSANRVPEISDSIVEIDRAMRLGFNWELGPFELVGCGGRRGHCSPHEERGQAGRGECREAARRGAKNPGTATIPNPPPDASTGKWATEDWEPVQVPAGVWSVTVAKKSNGVVKKNSGASLVDLGDGVGCIEFHSKMNSLGADIISLILQTLKPGGPGDNFDAFVITNDAHQFLSRRQPDAAADERAGRGMGRRRPRHPAVPGNDAGHQVLAQAGGGLAPFGLCLGGGTEISLHAAGAPAARRALYRAGGSRRWPATRRRRLQRNVAARRRWRRCRARRKFRRRTSGSIEMLEAMKRAFETIATAKVATSAHEARGLGFLTDSDRITMNRERVLTDAKARALELVRAGYEPPVPRTRYPRPRRKSSGHDEDGCPHDAPGRLHYRLRGEARRKDRRSPMRRQRHAGHAR